MREKRYDLYMKAGQTVVLDITWTGDEGPLDMTNAWVAATFRSEYGGTELFTVSSTTGEITFGIETGQIIIRIPTTHTALLNTGEKQTKGVFDVKAILGTEETDFPIWDGRWYCDPVSTTSAPEVVE